MADYITTDPILSLYATTGERVKDLSIEDGNLIFIQDKHRIALDFGGKRRFYNQIEELSTEAERQSLLAPISGMYYFVISTATLWTYQSGWIQITSKPEEIVFIGATLPELGKEQTLYVNKVDKAISVWDADNNTYVVVSDYTNEVTEQNIIDLFE